MYCKIQTLSKENLVKALLKRKECEVRAQRIVESLLDRYIAEAYFLEIMQSISQCHYNDVIEERHILRLCSYPLCSTLVETVPAKKFQISTATNKVYDITDRKKFCSSHCYKASEYIKVQIPTTPLWLRYQEHPSQFKLLKCKKNDEFTNIFY